LFSIKYYIIISIIIFLCSAISNYGPTHFCRRDHTIARLLIDAGADVNQVYDDPTGPQGQTLQRCTPLMATVTNDDKEMISLLLNAGARDERNEVLMTCLLENNMDMVKFLLKHKARTDNQHKLQRKHNVSFY